MQTKPKTNSIVTHRLNDDGTLTFTVKDAGEFSFNPKACHADIAARAALHGYVQRISDGAAMSRDAETGRPATPEEKRARMEAIARHMESGTAEWTMRASGGGSGPDAGLIVQAMVQSGIATDVDDANAKLAALATKRGIERKEALRLFGQTKQVLDAIAAIKAARSSVNAEDLLSEI